MSRQGVKILLLYYSVIIIIIIIIIIISIIFHSYSQLSASNVKIYALSFNCIAFHIFFKEPLSPTFVPIYGLNYDQGLLWLIKVLNREDVTTFKVSFCFCEMDENVQWIRRSGRISATPNLRNVCEIAHKRRKKFCSSYKLWTAGYSRSQTWMHGYHQIRIFKDATIITWERRSKSLLTGFWSWNFGVVTGNLPHLQR